MRHKIKTQNLSRFSTYFKATVRSLCRAMIIHQRIVTTKTRAKIARRHVDRLISLGKELNSLAARRQAYAVLNDHGLVKRLFTDIAPAFKEKNGGYSRIIPYKIRRGDNAEMVVLELSLRQTTAAKPVETKERSVKVKPVRKEKAPVSGDPVEEKAHDVAPDKKQKHEADKKKPARKFKGFGKIFKQERDSL